MRGNHQAGIASGGALLQQRQRVGSGLIVQAGRGLVGQQQLRRQHQGRPEAGDPLWSFLVRPWIWPPLADIPWLLLTGCSVVIGGLMVAQAYRTTEAAVIAPFDYTGMPMAIFWGVVIFGTWPDLISWCGIALICGSGIYVVWREATLAKRKA